MFKKYKGIKQRVKELEKTCVDLEKLIDSLKESNSNKDFKNKELKFRLKLAEQEKIELNNVITNLMSDKNELALKNINTQNNIKKLVRKYSEKR